MNCNNQGSGKCIDFNEEQIKEYLEELKKLILSGQCNLVFCWFKGGKIK